MSKNKEKVDRRNFLKMSAIGAAAGGAAIASNTVSAELASSNKYAILFNKKGCSSIGL